MVGLSPPVALDRGTETATVHDRSIAAAGIAAVALLAWLYLWICAAGMDDAALAAATVPQPLGAGALALTFLMWAVMMVGMMLPGAAPTILLYGTLVKKNGAIGRVLPGVWTFAGGYLLVWTAFSAAATLLQALLEQASLMTPEMTLASTRLNALALIGAGVYQLTPLKQACLGKCRNPLEFFITRWRGGTRGALWMGLEHGAYCVGCCWALMLLLFVAGVMNLLWVALIAAFVFAEKALPASRLTPIATSAVLVSSGLVLLARI